MVQLADYAFVTGRFRMVTADSHEFVADFDVQRFGPNGCWPVVATIGPKGTTWSVYSVIGPVMGILAVREESSDGGVEVYDTVGTPALPFTLEDGERWSYEDKGQVTYTSPQGSVERGTFTYKNAAWAAVEADDLGSTPLLDHLLYWLEQYTENYGAGDVVYERLHCFSKGEGLQWYIDMNWNGGVKMVTRS